MSQDRLIKLLCKDCKEMNYMTSKNKRKVERKITLQKFCKSCKKRTEHKEGKK
ncbi:MAG TPA: 50S ribosomal protein L33 [Candidatus Paceibacterota bacterium]